MTSFRANKPRQLAARCAIPLLAAAMMVLGGARAAWAHQDPATCTHPGVAIVFKTFRADGVTEISGTETVSPCETIFYQVTLSRVTDPAVCAFEAGKIFITTADGVQHDVTPTTGVPCVGGTVTPCDPSEQFVDTQKLSFTVNQPSGQVGATANYGLPVNGACGANSFCGTEHNSPSDLVNVVSSSLASATTVAPCPASTPCLTSLCDPSARDQFGIRMGLCVTQNGTDGTPCAADTAGNPVTAIPGSCKTPGCEAGECVRAHINVTDSTACSADNTGNPVTAIPGACKTPGCEAGVCVTQHIPVTDSTACSADNAVNPVTAIPGACKTPGCEAGQCVRAHITVTDSTACSADNAGNPVTAVPGSCKTPGCEAGKCVRAHITVTDSTACSVDNAGNPVTAIPGACKTPGCEAGVCVTQHIPVTDSTTCSVDNAGNPVTAIPGSCKLPGCEAGQCVAQHASKTDSTPCSVDANGNPVTPTPGCQPGCEAGVCTATHVCQQVICRTPGFWGTHAGREKSRSQNITQAVINAGGGCIEICGELITDTALNDANSAVEAICASPRGNQNLQLVRQLTAAALNCIMSNGNPDCTGLSIQDVFQTCNTACAAGDSSAPDSCIGLIDCFNNGGVIDPSTGNCVTGLSGNCESQPLINQSLNLDFEPPGPAGSSGKCNNARGNSCTVIPPGETSCGAGLKCGTPETCGQTTCP